MDQESQKTAQQILQAIGAGGPLPEVGYPGEAPSGAGATPEAIARYDAALDKHHEYLMSLPAGRLNDAQKKELWRASVKALGLI